MKKLIILITVLLLSCMCVSCKSASDIYSDYDSNSSYKRLFDETNTKLDGMNVKQRSHYYAMKALNASKVIALIASAFSIVLGLLLRGIIKKDKKKRKIATFTFMIEIPIFAVIIVALIAAIAVLLS